MMLALRTRVHHYTGEHRDMAGDHSQRPLRRGLRRACLLAKVVAQLREAK
jgi:hypothetical protein